MTILNEKLKELIFDKNIKNAEDVVNSDPNIELNDGGVTI